MSKKKIPKKASKISKQNRQAEQASRTVQIQKLDICDSLLNKMRQTFFFIKRYLYLMF